MDFNGLLTGLGAHIGCPQLAPGDDGVCRLTAGGIDLVFSSLRDGAAYRLTADLGPAPQKHAEAFCISMLEANARFAETDGPVLARRADTGRLLLCRCDSAADMTADRFLRTVGHFIGTAELWKNLLAANEGLRPQPGDDDAEEAVTFHGYSDSAMLGV